MFLMTKSRPQRGSRAQSVSVVPRVPGTQVILKLEFAKTNFDHKLHCNISGSTKEPAHNRGGLEDGGTK